MAVLSRPDANSYASVADSDAYHEGHLYATAWTGATTDNKAASLVMAVPGDAVNQVLLAAVGFVGDDDYVSAEAERGELA